MHLLVTDRLCCVRCGPEFGLILLAEELTDRRVLEGYLGCANCRERYPVEGGFGDLRPPPRDEASEPPEAPPSGDPEEAFRLAAMLGVTEGPGLLLLAGDPAGQATRLAGMLEGVEVVALHPGLRREAESPGVSRIAAEARLPFYSGSLRGVALDGPLADTLLPEAVRVLAPGGRLVLRSPSADAADRLGEMGLELFLETGKAVVGGRG